MDIGAVLLKLPTKDVKRLLYALVILVSVSVTVLKQASLPDVLFLPVINTFFIRIAIYDMEHRRIKNIDLGLLLFLKLIWFGIHSCFGTDVIVDILECVILALITLLLCLTVRVMVKNTGLSVGDGDFKYLSVISFCVGFDGFLMTLLFAFVIAVVLYLIFRLSHRAKTIPAAPMLSLAAMVGFLFVI